MYGDLKNRIRNIKEFKLNFLALLTMAVIAVLAQILRQIISMLPWWRAYIVGVTDVPYVLFSMTIIFLVRKPGAVTLTFFLSTVRDTFEDPLWWVYPFIQGVMPDLYLLFRGPGVFTDKLTLFKFKATPEELEASRGFRFMPFIDGAVIYFLRTLFWQLFLILILYPRLFQLHYDWTYALLHMATPWAIGNAIAGALSVIIIQIVMVAIRKVLAFKLPFCQT